MTAHMDDDYGQYNQPRDVVDVDADMARWFQMSKRDWPRQRRRSWKPEPRNKSCEQLYGESKVKDKVCARGFARQTLIGMAQPGSERVPMQICVSRNRSKEYNCRQSMHINPNQPGCSERKIVEGAFSHMKSGQEDQARCEDYGTGCEGDHVGPVIQPCTID